MKSFPLPSIHCLVRPIFHCSHNPVNAIYSSSRYWLHTGCRTLFRVRSCISTCAHHFLFSGHILFGCQRCPDWNCLRIPKKHLYLQSEFSSVSPDSRRCSVSPGIQTHKCFDDFKSHALPNVVNLSLVPSRNHLILSYFRWSLILLYSFHFTAP
jgi:hypothetical protein